MRLLLWVALPIIACVSNAQAQQTKTALQLKKECEAAEQLIATVATQPVPRLVITDGVSCFGYLRGYLEAVAYLQAVRDAKPIYCGEKTRDFRQLAATYVKYVNAHPEGVDSTAANTVANVIAEIAPCKQ